jgi:adenylosuccinate synthase
MKHKSLKDQSRVLAVVGGQYGSEGKGNIVAYIANEWDVHVRTGGSNAGHSFKHLGVTYAMQSVPVGWINPTATLIIGAGAVIDLWNLVDEVEMIRKVDPSIVNRLKVDAGAFVINSTHKHAEGGTKGELHKRIGSTGKGVGTARIGRIKRSTNDAEARTFEEHIAPMPKEHWIHGVLHYDTVILLERFRQIGKSILLEGTQGSGLSLIHGPWPYVTSADTNAAQLAADAGLPPSAITDVLLVYRTFPIRVAGNSGPLRGELTWEDISEMTGKPTTEITTVTKKTRRIGKWDWTLAKKAIILNAPTMLAINFIDYSHPDDEGIIDWEELSEDAREYVLAIGAMLETPVRFVGTGGEDWAVVDVPKG